GRGHTGVRPPVDAERRGGPSPVLSAARRPPRLTSEQPERVPELHRRAAAWHEEHGSADEAVRHALAAGEPDWAARLVERHVEGFLQLSEVARVRPWLSALPAASVRARPRLLLAQPVTAVLGCRLEAIALLRAHPEREICAGC